MDNEPVAHVAPAVPADNNGRAEPDAVNNAGGQPGPVGMVRNGANDLLQGGTSLVDGGFLIIQACGEFVKGAKLLFPVDADGAPVREWPAENVIVDSVLCFQRGAFCLWKGARAFWSGGRLLVGGAKVLYGGARALYVAARGGVNVGRMVLDERDDDDGSRVRDAE